MDNEDLFNENNNNKGCLSYIPCGRFIITAGITIGSFVYGCVMLSTSGLTAPLTPFYTSLITASISIWAPTPSPYPDKK